LRRAEAQRDTQARTQAQRAAAQAVRDAQSLLRAMLDARWQDDAERRRWCDALAQLSIARLRPGAWRVEHPAGWRESEQHGFAAATGRPAGIEISFAVDGHLKSGLRIKADGAVLDATPQGLLADSRAIAALLLEEIRRS
jgi:type II secretory pathway pseudopilin PulG